MLLLATPPSFPVPQSTPFSPRSPAAKSGNKTAVDHGLACEPTTLSAVAGCSSKDLTRDQAKQLIQASGERFTLVADDRTTGVGAISLSDIDVEWGMRRGYWTSQNTLLGQQLTLTEAGKATGLQFVSQGMGSIVLKLSRRVRGRVIEVTGISGISGAQESSDKIAEFTWQLETTDLTPAEQDLLKDRPPVQGKARFKLYDDGWRVQEVSSHGELESLDRPWREWRHGNHLTAVQLAQLLKPFGIRPGSLRVGSETGKGYDSK